MGLKQWNWSKALNQNFFFFWGGGVGKRMGLGKCWTKQLGGGLIHRLGEEE